MRKLNENKLEKLKTLNCDVLRSAYGSIMGLIRMNKLEVELVLLDANIDSMLKALIELQSCEKYFLKLKLATEKVRAIGVVLRKMRKERSGL